DYHVQTELLFESECELVRCGHLQLPRREGLADSVRKVIFYKRDYVVQSQIGVKSIQCAGQHNRNQSAIRYTDETPGWVVDDEREFAQDGGKNSAAKV